MKDKHNQLPAPDAQDQAPVVDDKDPFWDRDNALLFGVAIGGLMIIEVIDRTMNFAAIVTPRPIGPAIGRLQARYSAYTARHDRIFPGVASSQDPPFTLDKPW